MSFYSRIDDLIDIAGSVRLTEGIIWRAIENTRIPYSNWTARKEITNNEPCLHLFIETIDPKLSEKEIELAINAEMKKLDNDYARLTSGGRISRPIAVTKLPSNSFKFYMSKMQDENKNTIYFSIPHINPSDKMLEILLSRE